MNQERKINTNNDNNVLIELWLRFFPFWPLFVILSILSVAIAWFYIHKTAPTYEANATIIIEDENKGVDAPKLMETLNPFITKKTVENEIEVIRSRSLMNEVVKRMNLVASIFEDTERGVFSAYKTSPISIEVANPDSLLEISKVYFNLNIENRRLSINGRVFPINTWTITPYGKLKFIYNKSIFNTKSRFYFSLYKISDVVRSYISRLKITPTSKLSTVLTLSLIDESPQRAEDVLDNLVEAYDKAAVREKNSLASNTLSFVENRLAIVSRDLDSIEQKIQSYRTERGAIDISAQGKLFLENVSLNDQKLSEINTKIAVLGQIENNLLVKDQDGGVVPSTVNIEDPILTKLLNGLYENEIEYSKLKKTYAENHPLISSIKAQIDKIKPIILENIRSQERSLLATRLKISQTNDLYSSTLQTIPRKERELLKISREQAIKTNIYNFLLQKREEAAISHSSVITDSRSLDKAQASFLPVWPRKSIVFPAAVILAVIVSFIIIMLLELLNGKVLSRSDIESVFGIPILGELIYINKASPFSSGDWNQSVINEQFRRLKMSLPYLGITADKKKILITSCISGDGKSFTAANLALSLAIEGKRIVVIEFDLINPSLSNKFGLTECPGITDYLKGEVNIAEIIKPTNANSNLYLITAGQLANYSSELMTEYNMQSLLNYLEEHFDIILIDTAPVGLISDAYYLSRFCDASLFIIRHNHTPKVLLKRLDIDNTIYEVGNTAIIYNGIIGKGINKHNYTYGYNYLLKEQGKAAKKKEISIKNSSNRVG